MVKVRGSIPVFWVTAVTALVFGSTFSSTINNGPPKNVHKDPIDPEMYMDSTELITSKGYPCENHYITTKDGFILNMQRIPHGTNSSASRLKPGVEKPVIILQHGLESSSSCWLDNLRNESLAYLLADAGADVWLGNVRGNMYSTNHTTLKPTQREFWEWTWDEMAEHDLPAMVDHVVATTGVKQVDYLGHSQGTLIGFAGFSSNATLAKMIKRFFALAPVARYAHMETPIIHLAPIAKDIAAAFEFFGRYDFLTYNPDIMHFLAKGFCRDFSDELCMNILFLLGGYDRTHLNQTRIPVYVAHNPGGTSVLNILHFAQGIDNDRFEKFDWGSPEQNIKHYNQPTPPLYDLSKFNTPVVFYSGGHDILSDPKDVSWLRDQVFSSLLADHYIPEWEHLDFIWAFDAPKYCYNDVLNWVFK